MFTDAVTRTLMHQAILTAHAAGQQVLVEVGCGPKAERAFELAAQRPDRLYVGIDPNLVGGDQLPRLPPNLHLHREKATLALKGLADRRVCIDEVHVIAPNGCEDYWRTHVMARHPGRIGEWQSLTVTTEDLGLYASLVGQKLLIATEVYDWACYFYSGMRRVFGQVTAQIYAHPAPNRLPSRCQDWVRVRNTLVGDSDPLPYFLWRLDRSGEEARDGQIGTLSQVFGLDDDDVSLPFMARDRAPRSAFLDKSDAVFEIIGMNP